MEESSKENTSQYEHTINVHCYDHCGNAVLFSNHLALCHLDTTHLMGTVPLFYFLIYRNLLCFVEWLIKSLIGHRLMNHLIHAN